MLHLRGCLKVQFVVKSNTEKTYKSSHRAEYYSCVVLRCCGLKSAGLYVCRFETFSALGGLIFDLLAIMKGPEAGHRNVRVMDEQIVTTTIGSNESKSLIFVEPFYRTCIQKSFSLAPLLGYHTNSLVFYQEYGPRGKEGTPCHDCN